MAVAGDRVSFSTSGVTRMQLVDQGVGIGNTTSFGDGTLVVFIQNATVIPTTNPTGGGILYAEGGALKWRGSAGTVSTVAPA